MPDRENVIAMAREAGFCVTDSLDTIVGNKPTLEAFAALVAAQEREQCAKAIQALPAFHPENDGWGDEGGFAIMEPSERGDEEWVEKEVAMAAIRARKEEK